MISKQFIQKAFSVTFISLSILCLGLNYYLPDKYLDIFVLNIGQGDSILIKTPENHYILVDGGPGDLVLEELLDLLPYFNREIDLVILSHPHQDHLEGLLEVLRRIKVNHLLITGVKNESETYKQFLDLVTEKNLPTTIANEGSDFLFGEVILDTLYPFESIENKEIKNLNNSSIVFKLIYRDFAMLFTGDAEKEVENLLVKNNINLQANVLKVGHHGSKSSSTLDFLKKTKAEMAVISSGLGNKYNHPSQEALKNLRTVQKNITIKRTDQDGRIVIRANPD